MSVNVYSAVVGRKLAYARALLRQEAEHARDPVLRGALVQGALLHLQGAYHAFVREVGANYQLGGVDGLASALELVDALARMDKAPGEASELADLERDPRSWVGQLHQLGREAQGSVPPVAAAKAGDGLIDVKPAGGAASSTDAESVRSLLNALVEAVDRQRATMVEC